jgi:hypothetical protein
LLPTSIKSYPPCFKSIKNLIFVHRLASDNNVFLEFRHHFFCIKNLDLRNVLLKGPCQGGLYPLPSSSFKKFGFGVNKLACGIVNPFVDRWHSHLGHLSIPIVQRVIRTFNLPCLAQEIKDYVMLVNKPSTPIS